MNWTKRKVIVTGGAGFIGGTVVDQLLGLGANVTVVDKILLSGQAIPWEAKVARLSEIYRRHGYSEPQLSLVDLEVESHRFQLLARDYDAVFHLSAVFGGREFVDTRQSDCSRMLAIDHNVINAAYEAGVQRLHYASSACVYPSSLQVGHEYLLKEDDILSTGEGWSSSDNLYGFAKLMGELQCLVFHNEKDMKTSVCRYLTVYGRGEFDSSHAISALIAKALDVNDPYVVWGSGSQERGFTYVDDIARGSILAAEKITDATPINLGSDKRYAIRDVASMILEIAGHKPSEVVFDTSKPEGPFSRALDISRAKRLLGWAPEVEIEEGLQRSVEWHRYLRNQKVATRPEISKRKPDR